MGLVMVNEYFFKVSNSPLGYVKGIGTTEEQGRSDALAELSMAYPPECELGELLEVKELPMPKIDGPLPGTAAYTAFFMAQLYPNEPDGFWDDFKEELKSRD
jgi:hypothetical protein